MDELVETVAQVSGKKIRVVHIDGPVGVMARYHGIDRMAAIGWQPRWSLIDGIRETYPWIEQQVRADASSEPAAKT